jgi:hypothetical protein
MSTNPTAVLANQAVAEGLSAVFDRYFRTVPE